MVIDNKDDIATIGGRNSDRRQLERGAGRTEHEKARSTPGEPWIRKGSERSLFGLDNQADHFVERPIEFIETLDGCSIRHDQRPASMAQPGGEQAGYSGSHCVRVWFHAATSFCVCPAGTSSRPTRHAKVSRASYEPSNNLP